MFGLLRRKLLSLVLRISFSKMYTGSKKVEKPERTKYRKNIDDLVKPPQKKKHHDRSFYRLVREEEREYDLQKST